MTTHTDFNLSGKIAFVTGGSNGIGAASVRMLAEAGAQIVIGYNNGLERAETLMAELPGEGHSVQQLSLEESGSAAKCATAIGESYGKLDILVNSAGFTQPIPHGDLNALSDDFVDSMLIANIRGPLSVVRECAPLLKKGGESVVINVSSVSAFTGSGSNIAYCASKAALDTMTMSLARALGPEIRVLCVSPGAVATDFVAGRGRDRLEKIAESSPIRRVVEPEDVARTVLACVTHLKTSTGTRIVCDGGRFLG